MIGCPKKENLTKVIQANSSSSRKIC